jgi:hypothetical protein
MTARTCCPSHCRPALVLSLSNEFKVLRIHARTNEARVIYLVALRDSTDDVLKNILVSENLSPIDLWAPIPILINRAFPQPAASIRLRLISRHILRET